MIDIHSIEQRIQAAAVRAGATVMRTGYSDKSDSVYINLRKAKEISAEYGVMESWAVLVRVSNHDNRTNTHDLLTADLYVDISDADTADQLINDVEAFLTAAECVETP